MDETWIAGIRGIAANADTGPCHIRLPIPESSIDHADNLQQNPTESYRIS